MPVSFKNLCDTFELLDMANPLGEYQAYIGRASGEILSHSDEEESAGLVGRLPDDIDDETKYIRIPDKRELGLGKTLALDFAREHLSDDDYQDVLHMFSRKGGYRKFKSLLLSRHGAREAWFAYENKATEQALRHWCELNDLELSE